MADDRITRLYYPVLRTIVRQWSLELGPAGKDVLLFINERTFRFGKATERIPIRHFVEGVHDHATDECIVTGTGHKKTSIKKALSELRDQQLITYRPPDFRGQWQGAYWSLNAELILSKSPEIIQTQARGRVKPRRQRKPRRE